MAGRVLLFGSWRPVQDAVELLRPLNHPGQRIVEDAAVEIITPPTREDEAEDDTD